LGNDGKAASKDELPKPRGVGKGVTTRHRRTRMGSRERGGTGSATGTTDGCGCRARSSADYRLRPTSVQIRSHNRFLSGPVRL
jgi:hypothetical protein